MDWKRERGSTFCCHDWFGSLDYVGDNGESFLSGEEGEEGDLDADSLFEIMVIIWDVVMRGVVEDIVDEGNEDDDAGGDDVKGLLVVLPGVVADMAAARAAGFIEA